MKLKPIKPKLTDDKPMGVSRALKAERLRLGMTQKEFGVATGVCQQRVFKTENDKGLPSLSRMIEIAKALDCSLDYLCGLTKVRSPLPKK